MVHNGKMTDSERRQVLQWLAEFETVADIKRRVQDEFGRDISLQAIYRLRDRNAETIAQMRHYFLAAVTDIPIANKAYRIKQRQALLEKLLSKQDRVKYVKNSDGRVTITGGVDNYLAINRLLDSVAREMEDNHGPMTEALITQNLSLLAEYMTSEKET
jgi:hypothetical protein